MKIETANQLCGRATHTIFFAGFGALWLTLGCGAMHILGVAAASVIALGLTVLILAALPLFRLAKQWPRIADDPAVGRARNGINVVLGLAIALVSFAMSRLNLDAYLPSALTAIAGLHKFSLARLFRYSSYYTAGAMLLVWAVASIIFLTVEDLQGIAALGTGVILWLNAATTLAIAWRNARQSRAALTYHLSNSPNAN
jgi:hypothetical protein